MAKKKRIKKLTAAKLVKAAAREHVGMPPAGRVVPHKKKTPREKHKATLGKLLDQE